MKTIIEASGLDYKPKLVETGNGWATVYGSQIREFDSFSDALDGFSSICDHAAKCSGIFDDEDYENLEVDLDGGLSAINE
jgi:hypothetical protein